MSDTIKPIMQRNCKWCGKPFETRDKRQVNCTRQDCISYRKIYYTKRWREKNPEKEAASRVKQRDIQKRRREAARVVSKFGEEDRKRVIEKYRRMDQQEKDWAEHGFEWGRIKAERTLANVPKIDTDMSRFK